MCGYYDNLPISLALRMGAQEVIAIELHTKMTHEHYHQRPTIKTIIPSHDLGNFLDFDRNVLDRRITLGYLDTMKAFGKLNGYEYAFKLDETIDGSLFYHSILRIEDKISRMKSTKIFKQNCPLTGVLMEHCTNNNPTINDYYLLGFEKVLAYDQYPYDVIYDFHEAAKTLYDKFITHYNEHTNNEELVKNMMSFSFLQDKMKQFSTKERIFYYYQQLCLNDSEITMSIQLFEKEFIIALFMYCYSKTNS